MCVFLWDKKWWWWCACYAILFLGFDSHSNLIKKKLCLSFILAYLHFHFHPGFWLFERKIVWMCVFLSGQNWWWCACYAILFLGFDPHPKRIKKKLYFIFIHAYLHFGFWLFERKIGWTLKIEMLGGFWALKKIGFLWECGFRGYTGCYCRGCGACSGCCKESPCKEQRQRLGQCFRGSSC